MIDCATTFASGGASSLSMILCCSHYLINILPFIGISAFASITQYTLWFILVGIIANIIGISMMLYKYNKLKRGKNC